MLVNKLEQKPPIISLPPEYHSNQEPVSGMTSLMSTLLLALLDGPRRSKM